MPSSIFLGNSGSGTTTFFNGDFESKRQINVNVISSNRHDVSIVWLDTKMDPKDIRTQQLLNQLNDKVELFNDLRDCLNSLYERQETILLIVSGKCASQCLRSIHPLSSIDSIIIFCASPEKYHHLTNETYTKILACIATEAELIQYVHTWIDLKCQTHFYTWNNNQSDDSKQLTRQTALFLANHLLPTCIQYQAYRERKQEMLKICRAYYGQHPLEADYIEEFELTYTPSDAIMWYTRDSFIHKIVNRTLRSFDNTKLRAIAFYIRDLREQLCAWRFTTSSKDNITVYHGLIMTQSDVNRIQTTPIGSLLSTNGFLSTSRKREIAETFATKRQNVMDQPLRNVLLEIDLGVDNSPTIFADVGHISAFPNEYEVLFDIGTVLCLQNVNYDDKSELWIIKLTLATQNDYKSIENFLKRVQYELNEPIDEGGQIPLIGKLLNINNQFDEPFKRHDDYWQKFSLFRTAFNTIWHSSHDKYKDFFEEHIPWIAKMVTNYLHRESNRNNKMDNSNSSNIYDCVQDNKPSSARFEPILFFYLNQELMQDERNHLSSLFSEQYRRFITKHLTPGEIENNLGEFYSIFYIASEIPLYMRDNPRIIFYSLDLSEENPDTINKIELMERLISQLLHDLGMFYPKQAKSLSNEKYNQGIPKRLIAKAAKCYQLLASETEKTIERYNQIE